MPLRETPVQRDAAVVQYATSLAQQLMAEIADVPGAEVTISFTLPSSAQLGAPHRVTVTADGTISMVWPVGV